MTTASRPTVFLCFFYTKCTFSTIKHTSFSQGGFYAKGRVKDNSSSFFRIYLWNFNPANVLQWGFWTSAALTRSWGQKGFLI